MISFFKTKVKAPAESHVILTTSSSGDTMVHLWKGDNIDSADSFKLNETQAIKLRDALVGKFGV